MPTGLPLGAEGEKGEEEEEETFRHLIMESPHAVDDATWILTSSFVILTMQSGFGLLEGGYLDRKSEVNIMMKNAVDVSVGGISFWMFGYGLAFGRPSNQVTGFGDFFVDAGPDLEHSGWLYARFIFQFSFAATATTIVSGCVAQRCKFLAYLLFAMFNTLIYSIAAHWVWDDTGWLSKLGFHDFAGDGPVHVLGACNGAVGAYLLGPRSGQNPRRQSTNGVTSGSSVLHGVFLLWWGWIGFNCGSTFGLSEGKWSLAARISVVTVNSSCAGGVVGLIYSSCANRGRYLVDHFASGTIGALVAITAPCACCSPRDAIFIGAVGALVAIWCNELLHRTSIDDPVGAIGVHGAAGVWGLLAVAIFSQGEKAAGLEIEAGLIYGGGAEILAIQALGIAAVSSWSVLTSFLMFKFIGYLIGGIRLSAEQERDGADATDHEFVQTSSTIKGFFSMQTVSNLGLTIYSRARSSHNTEIVPVEPQPHVEESASREEDSDKQPDKKLEPGVETMVSNVDEVLRKLQHALEDARQAYDHLEGRDHTAQVVGLNGVSGVSATQTLQRAKSPEIEDVPQPSGNGLSTKNASTVCLAQGPSSPPGVPEVH